MTFSWQDVKLAARSVFRSPGYSFTMALTLALAIGANTLLFSVANPLVIRALPIGDPDGLGWIAMTNPEREIDRGQASLPDLLEWRERLTSFSSLAAYDIRSATLTGLGDARRIATARVTTNLPDVWQLTPAAGRFFSQGDDEPGRPLVGVLSFRFWQEAFAGSSSAIGASYAVDGKPIAIVGVMPKSIELGNLSLIDVWTTLPLDPAAPRDGRTLRVVGRLQPGATVESATAELQGVFAAQQREHPEAYAGWQAEVRSTKAALASPDTWVVLALLGVVVVFVLLIACANLANLVLARLVSRRRELAVRVSLGATRWQLMKPLLTEGLLLSLAGGLAGLGIAYGGLKAINAVAVEPFMRELGIDRNVLVFNILLSVMTPLMFTLWPVLSAGRAVTAESLHGVRATGGRGTSRRRNLLVGAQVALALALLVLSALVTQSMLFLQRIDPGYDAGSMLTYRFDLPEDRYPDSSARAAFARALEPALASIPGASGAAIVSHLPVVEGDSARVLSGTLRDGLKEEERPWASWFAVSPGFFQAAAIPVLQGRGFTAADRDDAQPVAVVNRLAAERYFDSVESALGRSVTIHDSARGERSVAIVGVVADTRDAQLTRSSPQIYVPFDQWPSASVRAVIRSSDPAAQAREAQAVMRLQDRNVAVSELKPVSTILDEELSSTKIINGLFVSFALLALALAAAGLFGVISYSVGQRRQEIGVRLALGAAPRTVARMIVGEGLKVVAAGMILGLVLAVALARASASVLYGVTSSDLATYGGVVGLILLVGLFATLNPAARAMRIDPARTLRGE